MSVINDTMLVTYFGSIFVHERVIKILRRTIFKRSNLQFHYDGIKAATKRNNMQQNAKQFK